MASSRVIPGARFAATVSALMMLVLAPLLAPPLSTAAPVPGRGPAASFK